MAPSQLQWDLSHGIGSPVGVGLAPFNRLAVASNLDGRLEAFAAGGDGAIWHAWQQPSGGWSAWASLGVPPGVNFAGQVGLSIQVVQNADGRLEVFVLDDDWNVWHIWQVAPNVNWVNAWASLATPEPGKLASEYGFIVASNEIRECEVFMLNEDTGEIFCRSQNATNGNWEPAWTSLGIPPVVSPYTPLVSSFTVAGPNGNLFFQVIALGSDNNLWHRQRSRFVVGGDWSGWSMLSAGPNGVELDTLVVVRENLDRRLELLARAPNGDLWHTWQSSVIQWSGEWDNFKQPPQGAAGAFDMQLDIEERLTVVTWGDPPQTIAETLRQTAPNNGWTGWNALRPMQNPNEFGDPTTVLIVGPKSMLYFFSFGLGKEIYYIPQVLVAF